MKKEPLIKCPYCGYEYMPGEIFIPKYLVGQAKDIERDENGKIIYTYPEEFDNKESFDCIKCNKTFEIEAFIEYKVKSSEMNFDEDYTSEKYPDRITLKED